MNIKKLRIFRDDQGVLLPLDFRHLPFRPKRVFYVYGVPKRTRRGCHAHYKTWQYIVCLSGKIRVGLHDGIMLTEKIITSGEAILIEPLIWDYQDFLTGHDLISVLCSTPYNRKDYITNFNKFLKIKTNHF